MMEGGPPVTRLNRHSGVSGRRWVAGVLDRAGVLCRGARPGFASIGGPPPRGRLRGRFTGPGAGWRPQVTAWKRGPGRARETPPPAAQGVFPAALALE